jgi:hypothetical protein
MTDWPMRGAAFPRASAPVPRKLTRLWRFGNDREDLAANSLFFVAAAEPEKGHFTMARASWVLLTLVLFFSNPAAQAQVVADLNNNWSDTSNPIVGSFGSWTNFQGLTPLPHVPDWTPLGASTPQPAWAPSTTAGNIVPAEFKATSAQFGWQTGDIIIDTYDPTNGGSNGFGHFQWTTPSAGNATVSGSVFEGRVDPGRNTVWFLSINGLIVSQGMLIAGDGHDRSNPFLFSNGSGGPGVLVIPNVTAGTTFDLIVAKTGASTLGDFVGVSYSISVVGVPEPASVCLVGIACAGLAVVGLTRRWQRHTVGSIALGANHEKRASLGIRG